MDAFLSTTATTLTAAPSVSLLSHEVKKIHIRTQQNGKKWITMVHGLDDDLDQARIARAMKKAFHCSATACINDTDGSEYIKLSGNQRDIITVWLVDNEVLTDKEAKARIVLHGA